MGNTICGNAQGAASNGVHVDLIAPELLNAMVVAMRDSDIDAGVGRCDLLKGIPSSSSARHAVSADRIGRRRDVASNLFDHKLVRLTDGAGPIARPWTRLREAPVRGSLIFLQPRPQCGRRF
jgi:hypothetical protein